MGNHKQIEDNFQEFKDAQFVSYIEMRDAYFQFTSIFMPRFEADILWREEGFDYPISKVVNIFYAYLDITLDFMVWREAIKHWEIYFEDSGFLRDFWPFA